MSELSKRLAKKIEMELNILCDPDTFRRSYAGFWMKTQGAFVWEMDGVHGGTIGSMYPASELVKKSVKLIYDQKESEIFPED